ncbi:hypothetical protein [Nguyenibacter sp. L1]|uniref:hypothetical protein n=1 Tax=Nguyenibacter sp. L1 TaxID=3049350 RepID=UPI002B46DDEB|nr:hypothetical protein [Nguyenibacter sp. L1]WRH88696.1 hypothetical protein QN315_03485 [Nguyenibacter sp. L1]
MSVPVIGLVLMPLCLLLLRRPAGLLALLLLAGAFPAGAAVIFGGLGVQPALVPALAFMTYAGMQRLLGARYPGDTAARALYTPFVLTTAWAVVGSLVMPRLFMDRVWVWPQKNDGVAAQVLLAPNFGNISQDLYLVLDVALMVLAAGYLTRPDIRIDRLYRAYLWTGWVVFGLCVWQMAHRLAGVPFPDDVLYSNPGWSILSGQMAGPVPRINASFSEPAACASFLSGILYSTTWVVLQGYRLPMARLLLPASAIGLLFTTSTTGFATVAVGLCLLPLAAMATGSLRLAGRVVRLAIIGTAVACFGVLIVAAVAPNVVPAAQIVIESTENKGDSQSYKERSMADTDALTVAAQTYGLGAGWGSVRASSLVPSLLSTVGVVGVVGLLVFDWCLLRGAMAARRVVPPCPERLVIDGCLPALSGRMIAALFSGPTIGTADFYLLMAMVIAATARITVFRARIGAADARAFAMQGARTPPPEMGPGLGGAVAFHRYGIDIKRA